MVVLSFVLGISILLQLTAAFLALRLIKITGRDTAWAFIAASVSLMAIRRCITLFGLVSGGLPSPPDLLTELVALGISALMAVGIARIAPLFLAIKRSEETLRESETRSRAVVEDQTELICRFLPDGTLTLVNEAYCRYFDKQREELIGHSFMPLIPEEDQKFVQEQFVSLSLENPIVTYEHRAVRSGGEIRWQQWTDRAIFDGQGHLVEFQSVGRDITERKRAEEQARQKTQDLALINSLNSAANRGDSLQEIVHLLSEETKKITSSDGVTIYLVNEDKDYLVMQNLVLPPTMVDRIERLTGIKIPTIKLLLKAESLYLETLQTGKPLLINDPATIQRLMTEFTETVSLPGRLRKTLRKLIPRILKVLGMQSVIIIPLVSEGEAIGLLDISSKEPLTESDLHRLETISGQLTAIIKRKRAEEALKASQEYTRNIIESSLDMLIACDMERHIVEFNKAAQETFGYRPEEVIGEHVDMLYADPQEGLAIHETTIRDGKCVQEILDRRKSGEVFPAFLSASVLRDASGETVGVMGIARNITDRKRAEEALRRRNRELALLNRMSQAFSSTIDLDQVLVAVLEEVRHLLDVVACSVWLTDPQTDELVCQQVTGPQSEIVRGWRLAPGQGLAGRVARSGESLIAPDVWANERHFKGVDQQTGLPLRSILTVPLRVKQNVIGVLQVVDTEVDRFHPADLELLEPLAMVAATAIENAWLYEQAQQDAKTKSLLLREVNHRVKNNLSAIVGLLYAERRYARMEDQAVYQPIMRALANRVQGLATVHSLLSISEWTPLLLSELTTQVIHSSLQTLPRGKRASVDVTPSPVRVTPDQAHNLALVINELATNTIRHTLRERDAAHISVRIGLDDETTAPTVLFEFRDDGPGYPEEVLQLERHNVGFDLIRNIVRKSLRGELSLHNDQGAVAVIRFKAQA